MNKNLILLFCFLLLSTSLKSQDKIKLFYNSDWKITKEGKAVYYRDSEYDLNDFELDGKVYDYTLSGNLIMEGNYLNGRRNGNFIFYYDNGKIRYEGDYKNNLRVGKWIYYYNNGQLKQVVLFNNIKGSNDIAVVEFYDGDGNQLIENGTGNWVNDSIQAGMFDQKSLKKLMGQFKDSLKHGEWKLIRLSDNKLMQNELFKKGKFISSKIYQPMSNSYGTISSEILTKIPDEYYAKFRSTEKFELDPTVFPETLLYADVETIFKTVTGKEYKIQNREAGYSYGDYSLLEFLQNNIRYPINAIEKRVTGKVYVGVVIDAMGNTKSVTLVKGVDEDLDNEAIRVVKLVNKWMPAIRDGKAVEATITIPVNFQLKE